MLATSRTSESAPAVSEICVRLDGLPLAIELAAARIALLSPQALLDRLDDRLNLLTLGPRDVDERQRTLTRTIGWSYDLLGEQGKELFARLSVFVGGCRLDAATAIADPKNEAGIDLIDRLQRLIDANLLQQAADSDGESRFWMLETIREFAADRLRLDRRTELVRTRHAEWCLTLAEQAEPFIWGAQEPAWLERLEAEHQNCRAALIWARDSGRVDLALRLAIALGGFWETRGHAQEGDRWLTELLSAAVEQPKAVKAKALWWAGNVAFRRDPAKANGLLEACLTIFRELGETQWIGRTLLLLGNVASWDGQIQEARSLFREAVTAARHAEDGSCVALAVGNLGDLLLQEGDARSAWPLLEESLALFEELGEKEGAAIALDNLGFAAAQQGDVDEAEACFRRALRVAHAIGFKDGILCALEGMAKTATIKSKNSRAARLLGVAMILLEATDTSLGPLEEAEHHRTSAAVRASLSYERFDALITSGMHMGLEEAIAYALEGDVVESSSPHRS